MNPNKRPPWIKDIDLSAGVVDLIVRVPGTFFYVDQASTGYASVEFDDERGGTLHPLTASAGFSYEFPFALVKINAAAQLNKTLRIVIATNARIKSGGNVNASSSSLSVVDGGLARTLADQAMYGYVYCPGVAAQNSHVMLWNPVGSGKNLYLEKIILGSPTAMNVLYGSWNVDYGVSNGACRSKLIDLDATPSVALPRKTTNAAYQVYNNGDSYHFLLAATPFTIDFREPIVIRPGYGFVAAAQTVNTTLAMNAEWYEQ